MSEVMFRCVTTLRRGRTAKCQMPDQVRGLNMPEYRQAEIKIPEVTMTTGLINKASNVGSWNLVQKMKLFLPYKFPYTPVLYGRRFMAFQFIVHGNYRAVSKAVYNSGKFRCKP